MMLALVFILKSQALHSLGRADTEYSRWQLQIMMDLSGEGDDPRGAPWYDLASRCLEVYVRFGRESQTAADSHRHLCLPARNQ